MRKAILLCLLIALAGCATLPEASPMLSRVDLIMARPSSVILAEQGQEAQEPSAWADGIVRIAQVTAGILEPWTVPAVVSGQVVQYAIHKAGNAQLLELRVLTPMLKSVVVTLDSQGRPAVRIEASQQQ